MPGPWSKKKGTWWEDTTTNCGIEMGNRKKFITSFQRDSKLSMKLL